MKKIVIKSKLPEDTIIGNLKTLTDDLRTRKLLQKSDELIDGIEEKDDKTFIVTINGDLMNASNYKLIAPELKKLGEVVSNDLKNFDDETDPLVPEDKSPENKKEEEKVVNEQALTPALSMHDTKELLFNVENMSKIESLLFSDEELGKTTPANPDPEKKAEEMKDPEPKKEPETKEHDKEDPKPADAPKPAEENKDPKPETTDPKPEDVKPEEGKPELHDGEGADPKPEKLANEEPKTPADAVKEVAEKKEEPEQKSFDSLYFDTREENFDTLYFSAEELQNYSTLLFDIEAEKKAAEEEGKDPEPKPAEEPKKDPELEPKPATEPKKEELHDGEPKPTPAPEGPKPEKKSLKEVLDEYEKTKKPYTNEQVASAAGVTVEEVAKMKKELGLMDQNRETLKIDADKALKALADIQKKADAGKDLNVVEKYFCEAMKKHFSAEEIEKAMKDAAPVDGKEISMSKMELIKKLNDEAAQHNLGLAATKINKQ